MSDEGIIFLRRVINGMSISGLWDGYHFKQPIKRLIYKTYGDIIFAIFMCFNISQFIEMYQVAGDFPLLMENLGTSLTYLLVLFRVYTLHFRTVRIGRLMDKIRLAEERAFKRPEEEIKIYYEAIDWSRFTTKWFWIMCSGSLIGFYIAPPLEYWYQGPKDIYNHKVPLLMSSWFPFDKYADGYYLIAYCYQTLSSTIGAYYIAVTDTFIVSFMIFGIGQFKMLTYAVEHLHKQGEEQLNKHDMKSLDVYDQVVEIVKHHIRTIEYIKDLDDFINPMMFLNFLICSLIICAIGFDGIMAGPSVHLVMNLGYSVALLLEVFNYYWHANEISIQSENVGRAVSASQWYNFTPKVKKALMMIMQRTQRPSMLSVGGFYFMSLSTYVMILKATYSYLALFREIYARE